MKKFIQFENIEQHFEAFYKANWFEFVFRVPDDYKGLFNFSDYIRRMPAVYLQLRRNGQVYVGKTNNLYKRTVRHRTDGVDIVSLAARYVPDFTDQELDDLETQMINRAINYGFDIANEEKLVAAHNITVLGKEHMRQSKIISELSESYFEEWILEHFGVYSRQSQIAKWLKELEGADAVFYKELSVKSQLFLYRYFELIPKAWKLYGDVWTMFLYGERLTVISGNRRLLEFSNGITMTLSRAVVMLTFGDLANFNYPRIKIEQSQGMVFVSGRITEIDRLLDEEWARVAVFEAFRETLGFYS